jgi:hypothetical protein
LQPVLSFEELFKKWLPVWFTWARLRREAQDEAEAKFGEEDINTAAWNEPLIATAPATMFLMEVIDRNGCARAGQEDAEIFYKMDAIADRIREAEVTSIAGLRAKCLVALLDFWPMFAGHDGNLSFDVAANSHFSVFAATVAVTGLGDFVGEIDKRLKADAGVTLRDGAPLSDGTLVTA